MNVYMGLTKKAENSNRDNGRRVKKGEGMK
jgi:hypothetical protein